MDGKKEQKNKKTFQIEPEKRKPQTKPEKGGYRCIWEATLVSGRKDGYEPNRIST